MNKFLCFIFCVITFIFGMAIGISMSKNSDTVEYYKEYYESAETLLDNVFDEYPNLYDTIMETDIYEDYRKKAFMIYYLNILHIISYLNNDVYPECLKRMNRQKLFKL